MDQTDIKHLRRAIELARLAREHGNHPFGAVQLFSRGNRRLEVAGPCLQLEAEARAVHAGFWR